MKLIIVLIILASILGCQREKGPRALVALAPVQVLKDHKGDAQQEIFALAPGDCCAVGREAYEKVFGYYEVVCPGKGNGWVVMGGDYKIVNRDSAHQALTDNKEKEKKSK